MATYNTNYANWEGSSEQSAGALNNEVEAFVWKEVEMTWEDVQLLGKISAARRKKTLDDYLLKNPKDKERLIHLICSVKGIDIYNEQKTVAETKIDVSDIDLLIKEVFGRMTIE